MGEEGLTGAAEPEAGEVKPVTEGPWPPQTIWRVEMELLFC